MRRQAAFLLGGAGLGFALLAVRPPTAGAYPMCPWLAITGLDCPFCGGMRSADALLHGNWATAVDYNLLAAVLVPVVLIGAVLLLIVGGRAQPVLDVLGSGRALSIGFAVLAGWFVLRMLPVAGWLTSTA